VNAILSRVEALRNRFDLDRFGMGDGASCVILTPRFRTSRHVVGLLFPKGAVTPSLVVKLPRLRDDGEGIEREAAVLRALREACPSLRATVPRVVALTDGDRPLLVETALAGRPLSPRMLRATSSRGIDAVVRWLIALSATRRSGDEASFDRLVGDPLRFLAESSPSRAPERELVARTLDLVEPLRTLRVPRVLEHGDLGHPNLLWLEGHKVGVVDWELAEEEGLPLHDLAFFLTYATFALRRPRTDQERVAAFHDAFFAAGGWAKARVTVYQEELGLEENALAPLFAACWARYTARLVLRIAAGGSRLTDEVLDWVRQNRYYALWRHTVAHGDELVWER
jgi:aminoglycoside phosphotransferase (APT) family kinase protein